MEDGNEEGQAGKKDLEGEEEQEEQELVNLLQAFEISHFGQVSTLLSLTCFAATHATTTVLTETGDRYWNKLF